MEHLQEEHKSHLKRNHGENFKKQDIFDLQDWLQHPTFPVHFAKEWYTYVFYYELFF